MRNEIILFDYENVQPTDLGALRPGTCLILVFVGQSQKNLPLALTQALLPFGTDVAIKQISGNGPNALDFHIALYIGRLAQEHPGARFTIVSKDTGFDPLVKHLATLKVACRRVAALAQGTKKPVKVPVATATVAKKAGVPAAKTNAKAKANSVVVTVLPANGVGLTPAVAAKLVTRPGVDAVVARLKGMKAARPTRLKTLQSSMLAWFKPALAANEVDAIIQSLVDRKTIKLDGAKVTYSLG